MSEFISWYEKNTGEQTEILFLTGDQVFNTPDGLRMQKEVAGDIIGHSAIRSYYQFETAAAYGNLPPKAIYTERECTGFSSPSNFPPAIVEAIKAGKMRGLGVAEGLLLPAVYAKWQAEWQAEWDAVYAKRQAELDAVYAKWRAEWDAVYAKRQAELDAVYAKWQPELDAVDAKFWDLFADPLNRAMAWR